MEWIFQPDKRVELRHLSRLRRKYSMASHRFTLLSSVKNVVTLCGTSNIRTDTPRDIADCIISIGSIFHWKSSGINVSVCGLIPREECWSVNRVLINEENEILKYQCNIDCFTFIFQGHWWTFTNDSLDCSLFYKDLLHLIVQGHVKLAKSITLTIMSTII